jgi:hypothetical protein
VLLVLMSRRLYRSAHLYRRSQYATSIFTPSSAW